MASNLVVGEGQMVALDESPPPQFEEAFKMVEISSFRDLVRHNLIESEDTLNVLFEAAQAATRSALNTTGTFRRVPGTLRRPDLGRFGAFAAAAPEVHPAETQMFWSAAREIPPVALVSARDVLEVQFSKIRMIPTYFFADVTIEPSATLSVTAKKLTCHALLIKHTGKLRVVGSGLIINASSIQGL
jgi:hypothetical protein